MKITVSSDEHSPLVDAVIEEIEKRGHAVEYFGPRAGEPASDDNDWPLVTVKAVSQVARGAADEAVVMCWTGTGASLAANKVPGIRAALTHDTYSAERAALSNNAQIITMGARVIGSELAKAIADAFLAQTFDENGRSAGNVQAINEVDAKYNAGK